MLPIRNASTFANSSHIISTVSTSTIPPQTRTKLPSLHDFFSPNGIPSKPSFPSNNPKASNRRPPPANPPPAPLSGRFFPPPRHPLQILPRLRTSQGPVRDGPRRRVRSQRQAP